MKTLCIILTGPTAVGKTAVSIALAHLLQGEIINGDVSQCYVPLTIGTAKPDWHASDVPHHLFDSIDTPATTMTVVKYREQVKALVNDICSRGKVPVIVGGSGFYIKSLFFPINTQTTQASKNDFSNRTTDELWKELAQIDPARVARLDKNDRYRIERALHIYHDTGALPSLHMPHFDPVADEIFVVVLNRDRADLLERITYRVLEMVDLGFIDEVQGLSPAWKDFAIKKNIIGYPEVAHFLAQGSHDRQALIESISIKTRQYAKRQRTFNRGLIEQLKAVDKSDSTVFLAEVNLTILDIQLYVEQLAHKIMSRK